MKLKLISVFALATLATTVLLTACGAGNNAAPGGGSASTSTSSNKSGTVNSLKLTMVGGSAGGFWSLLGEGVGNILRQSIPNTQYSYETGNGVKNIVSVSQGKVPLGIAHNFEVKAALEGQPPFQQKMSQVTALVALYNNAPFHIVISKAFADKYGIKSMEDIAVRKPPIRVAVDQRGNLTEALCRTVLEAYGISYDDIKKWGGQVYYEPYKPAADLMKDNKVDWIGVPVFAPDAKFMEVATTTDIVLLPVSEKVQKTMQERMGVTPGVIKANTYKFQPNDLVTFNGKAVVLADPNMSNDEAYTITRALVENIDKIRALHQNLKALTPEIMADVSPAKLHPGAEKYFKEIGILK